MKQQNQTNQTNHKQKTPLQGIQVRTGTRAGEEATCNQEAICQGCIQGFVAAMAEGVGLNVSA